MTTPLTTTECLVAHMGQEIGSLLRCIIQQEIQSHMDRIQQLQNILSSGPCVTTESLPTVNTTEGAPLPVSQ